MNATRPALGQTPAQRAVYHAMNAASLENFLRSSRVITVLERMYSDYRRPGILSRPGAARLARELRSLADDLDDAAQARSAAPRSVERAA